MEQAPGGGFSLATLLRTWRERALLTQEELALRTGLAARTIRRLEAYPEHPARPRNESVRLLADALQLSDVEREQLVVAAAARRRPDNAITPHQLPGDVVGFTGRADQLRHLDALLDRQDGGSSAVVISAIAGTAGVGKTALAIHWAHRVAERFPDGQLYVNLRGFDPTGTPTEPDAAVSRLLDALGVPARRSPADPEARVSLYRSMMAGRRILAVLDNASDAAQVRSLLPGTPGCLAIVTSRDPLTGLVASAGADSLILDLMSSAEAHELLTRRLGAHRVAAEPEAVREIITGCARLPLALAIASARAATHPRLSLGALAAELRDTRTRLNALQTGDAHIDVRSVISWSYRRLSPAAARLFRLLGLHPGPDVGVAAIASLAGVAAIAGLAGDVEPLLAELVRAHLVARHTPSRYSLHDVLRVYAVEQAHAVDPVEQRLAATRVLIDHYLHTAHAADSLLDPSRRRLTLPEPLPGANPEDMADSHLATAWFTTEHPTLLAVLNLAVDTGYDVHAWTLAWALATHLERRGQWHDWVKVQNVAVAATGRLGDRLGQARAHNGLGLAHAKLAQLDEASTHLTRALVLYEEVGDSFGQARAHLNLGWIAEQRDRPRDGLDHARRALALARAADDPGGQADALNNIGWYHALLGEYDAALVHCRRALEHHQQSGDRHGEADAWDSLGYAHRHLGQQQHAIDAYRNALSCYQSVGDRHNEAEALIRLGDMHSAAADHLAARAVWQQALTILENLNHPHADQLRTRLQRDGS